MIYVIQNGLPQPQRAMSHVVIVSPHADCGLCPSSQPGPRVATAAGGAAYYSTPCIASSPVGTLPQCYTFFYTGVRSYSTCGTDSPARCYIQIRVGGKTYWAPEHVCGQAVGNPAPFLQTTTRICAGAVAMCFCNVFAAPSIYTAMQCLGTPPCSALHNPHSSFRILLKIPCL